MALRFLRTHGLARRNPCSRALAVLVAGASVSLSNSPVAASDPKALVQGVSAPPVVSANDVLTENGVNQARETLPVPPANFAGQDGVLALFDGRVVSGKVTPAPGGYLIKRPGATDEMIPTFLVQTASDSLTGCYENLRDAIRTPRPDDHLELANWCVRQRLLHEAQSEVLAALKLDPNRREARDLLVKLEEATNPKPRHREAEAAPSRRTDGFLDSDLRSTEGLSPELTSQFVRRIQPLMVSKCGNAACHGGDAGGEFRLANIRRTSSSGRVTTLENMRQVVSLIDSPDPAGTRLLSALESPAHAGVFSGPGAEAQVAALRAWVQGAAGDKGLEGANVQLASGSSVWTPESIALATGKSNAAAMEKTPVTDAAGTHRPRATKKLQRAESPPVLRPVSDEAALAESILKEERSDPFDPEEFNRLVHSRFGSSPAGSGAGSEATPGFGSPAGP